MNRYYVEFRVDDENYYFYVYAYSEQHVHDIFRDHEILDIEQSDAQQS